jgi:MATE family multidrug resistance protein
MSNHDAENSSHPHSNSSERNQEKLPHILCAVVMNGGTNKSDLESARHGTPRARRNSNDSIASSSHSQISAMHLSESYSRPVFVLGSRPLLFSVEEPLPQGYLTRDERQQLDIQEQTLLENNDLLPNQAAILDTVMEIEEPIEFPLDAEVNETTSLLSRVQSRMAESHLDVPGESGEAREVTRAERRKRWEDAIVNQQLETTWKYEAKLLYATSVPMLVTFLLQYSLQFASIFSLGRLGRDELAAASLASMTASITMISVVQGLATSLDSLCAQSFGANQPFLLGLHLQRAVLLLLACLVPIGALWLTSEPLFLRFGQSSEIALLASRYLHLLLFGAPAFALFEALKRYAASQGIFVISTYALFIAAPLNAVLNYVLVWHPTLGIGFAGGPIAMSISYWTMFLCMLLFICYGKARHAWHGFSMQAFRHWGPMLKLAGPGLLMCTTEWFAYECMHFSASLIGVVPLAAQAIGATSINLIYQVSFGASCCVAARVGTLLGAGLPSPARTATNVGVGVSLVIGLTSGMAILALRFDWGRLFTDDEDVIHAASNILPLCALFNLFDCIQVLTSGVLRGQGRVHIGGWLNLAGYYLVAIPLGLLLCFKLSWGLSGLWTGMCVAIILISGCQTYYVLVADWQHLVETVQLRILASGEAAAHRHMA